MSNIPEKIAAHPFYPNDSLKQERLENAIKCGYIEREVLDETHAKYTLTGSGEFKWEIEQTFNLFTG